VRRQARKGRKEKNERRRSFSFSTVFTILSPVGIATRHLNSGPMLSQCRERSENPKERRRTSKKGTSCMARHRDGFQLEIFTSGFHVHTWRLVRRSLPRRRPSWCYAVVYGGGKGREGEERGYCGKKEEESGPRCTPAPRNPSLSWPKLSRKPHKRLPSAGTTHL
jgi:hypothetical protein